MQHVCMIGVEREGLLTAELSIEVSSGLQMGKTGFIERSRGAWRQVASRLSAAVG